MKFYLVIAFFLLCIAVGFGAIAGGVYGLVSVS